MLAFQTQQELLQLRFGVFCAQFLVRFGILSPIRGDFSGRRRHFGFFVPLIHNVVFKRVFGRFWKHFHHLDFEQHVAHGFGHEPQVLIGEHDLKVVVFDERLHEPFDKLFALKGVAADLEVGLGQVVV